jgi:hypothetical protein
MVATDAPQGPARLAWEHASRDFVREARWLKQLASEGLVTDPRDADELGWLVASLEPSSGDPQLVTVFPDPDGEGIRIDRRTMRPQQSVDGIAVAEEQVMHAADLADRAQLSLGEPVWLHVRSVGERLVILGIRTLSPRFQFTNASYRRTAALTATPGTLAPLSIDALERALKLEGDHGEEPRTRRLFGQAYRRIDEHHTPWRLGPDVRHPARALARFTRLGRDVTLAFTDAQRFRRSLTRTLPRLDSEDLSAFDTEDLLQSLRERMALVVEALALLERSRLSTLSLLPAIEVTVASLPRELFAALAAPKRTHSRRATDAQLLVLCDRIREAHQQALIVPTDPGLLRLWSQTKAALQNARVLGMDVRPASIGSDDEHLLMALEEAAAARDENAELRRKEAERRLVGLAAKGPLGPLGVGPVAAQITLLARLARAKGSVAEALSATLLRLRSAALEAGERLVADALLDAPDDALYMPLDEIEQALSGELGAYAARVRLRREDDRRFRNFQPPRRISARRP